MRTMWYYVAYDMELSDGNIKSARTFVSHPSESHGCADVASWEGS
jgi:hypothetical protein